LEGVSGVVDGVLEGVSGVVDGVSAVVTGLLVIVGSVATGQRNLQQHSMLHGVLSFVPHVISLAQLQPQDPLGQ